MKCLDRIRITYSDIDIGPHRLFWQFGLYSGRAEHFPEHSIRQVKVVETPTCHVLERAKNGRGAEDYEAKERLML